MRIKLSDGAFLYRDEKLLVVNKPAGIVTEGGAPNAPTLKLLVNKQYKEAIPVHRLDKDTTGAVLFALDSDTYRAISIGLQKREIKKTYHGIVAASVQLEDREVSVPLSKNASGKGYVDHKEGKPAVTLATTLEIFRNFSLLQLIPTTGRFHQLRVHMAHKGTPLMSDILYGGENYYLSQIKKNYKANQREELPLMQRQALHAAKLELPASILGEPLAVEAPYPKDMEVCLKLLRRYNAV